MTERELISRAEALGVSASYVDWSKTRVRVPLKTLRVIVDALGESPAPAGTEGAGADPRSVTSARRLPGPADQALPVLPSSRSWGFAVQLYSVRSRRSWGHGDLRDLADLARWSARQLGAGFILINPLHAAEPACPVSDSPYLPMTRRWVSPLYLRIEDIPEYEQLSAPARQSIERLAGPLRDASLTSELIDRDAVWSAKSRALELIYPTPRSPGREAEYRRFVGRGGADLARWATWCALAERHGPDARTWPAPFADPERAAQSSAGDAALAERAGFHAWLQWLADSQLAEAQRAALVAGMDIGVIGDLAVGSHPGGADAWAHQDLLVRGMSVGAPPDGFNQLGQDWLQPPWHPQRLAAAGARPLADLFGAAFCHAGGLRVDHVMGLMRLWWVPEGMTPDQGAYVSYDYKLTVGALTSQAALADAVAIGEDLGTVDPWIRRYLAGHRVLGTELAWFAREPDRSPLRPPHWRAGCMATVGTHDVPPVSGFVTGDQVTVRAQLGLLKDPQGERTAAELALAAWRAALVAERLLPPSRLPTADEFTVAMYGYLALTPAVLVGVSLADAVGERRTQNIPGTSREYPNWRVPLCDGEGKAVLIEDLPDIALVRDVVSAAAGMPRRRGRLSASGGASRSDIKEMA
ncbi:MAG TPA: 4-alpha-glucanotransferase [Streptosporangiaceae bacterium]|nr:4-alpha-glucanotransferase [Streptosporangiaceae bacterium]